MDVIKIKTFVKSKDTTKRVKKQPTEWEKNLQSIYLIGINIQNMQRIPATKQHVKKQVLKPEIDITITKLDKTIT